MNVSRFLLSAGIVMASAGSQILFGAEAPTERLHNASVVLKEMMRMDDKGIPQDLLSKAQCVVVVPGVKKAGFIIGAKYGKGFAACRKPSGGGWTAPAAIIVEGGSVGFQIGASEQDVIMLVMNEGGMHKLLQDKFTIGGEGTAAAGPIGRDATAQTDAQLHAEILSYSRSRGLFAGVALTGATMRPDKDANTELYGHAVGNREILGGDVSAPAAAGEFEQLLNRNSMHKEG
jgi:SH3 domain-containing YSC84-like protein 1